MEIYKDSSRPVSERVEDLLSRMTLRVKLNISEIYSMAI